VVAPGVTAVVAVISPMAFRHTIIFMKLLDNPTIISIVGVALVEDAVLASSALVTLRAVFVMVLLLGLHREDNSLLALGVLWLRLGRCCLWYTVHEEPPSSALVHLSAISKSLTTEVNSLFMDNFSFILMSATPTENAETTSSLEI
jgi:hypothetical protein